MFIKSLLSLVAVLGVVSAQAQNGPAASGALAQVPSDLSGGFKPDEIQLQVSFSNDAALGVPNGAELSTQQTSKVPTFALGDSSGVNTEIKFVIFMVDTTSSSDRVLHYVHSDFQATGLETGIASSSTPQLPWKGPGTLNDKGSNRQYTFLLYEQPGTFSAKGLPSPGQPVNVQNFVKQNGLQKAVAGQTIVVSTGNDQSQGQSQGQGQVQASQSQPQSSNSPAAAVASNAPSTVAQVAATSSIANVVSSAIPAAATGLSGANSTALGAAPGTLTSLLTVVPTGAIPSNVASVIPSNLPIPSSLPGAAKNAATTLQTRTWAALVCAAAMAFGARL